MRKKYFSLTMQIRISMGIILLLILVSGIITLRDVNFLWKQTNDIYHHPLTVRTALGNIQREINSIQTNYQRILLNEDERVRGQSVQSIMNSENIVYAEFTIVHDQFLGSSELVFNAENNFTEWKRILDGKIDALLLENQPRDLTGFHFEDTSQMDDILRESIKVMSDFADGKGNAFFSEAKKEKNHLTVNFIGMLLLFLLLTFFILLYLLRAIQTPLGKITTATERFGKGVYDARCDYTLNNEFGQLATAFNNLANTIQLELVNNRDVREVADKLLEHEDLEEFSLSLLPILMEKTTSQIGCIYFLSQSGKEYECVQSVGVAQDDCKSVSADGIFGKFGLAVANKKIHYIHEIPSDSFLCLDSISGKMKPKEIVVIPVYKKEKMLAVISLATLYSYTKVSKELLAKSLDLIVAQVSNVLSYEKIKRYSKEISVQNAELKTQKEELKLQTLEQNAQRIKLAQNEKDLIASNRLKSTFMSNMSHELRTPLNSIISLSNILVRKVKDIISEKELGYLKIIQKNGKGLLAIINDILDLSRIDAGKERIDYAVFSLHSLVESVIEIVLPQAQEKKVKIVNNINPQLPHIKSDIKKCKHIVQNLIGNAVKFTEDGQVTISSSIQSDTVEVVVADTGIGIRKENLATVFNEFRQLDDGITKKYEGTGLGLAIVKRYATLLGGSIRVKSEVGVGSEFTLTLPLYSSVNTNSNEIVKAVPSSGVVSSKDHSTHDVLIVEDNESAIIQLQEILEKEGYNIDVAKDGEEAINKINKTKPGAVILDLMLPRIDGFQVLKALRSDETMLDVPVLVLTAKYITREELSTLKGNNIYQLIQKGEVGADQLLTIINGMFALKDSK